jgi:hypothetical protein
MRADDCAVEKLELKFFLPHPTLGPIRITSGNFECVGSPNDQNLKIHDLRRWRADNGSCNNARSKLSTSFDCIVGVFNTSRSHLGGMCQERKQYRKRRRHKTTHFVARASGHPWRCYSVQAGTGGCDTVFPWLPGETHTSTVLHSDPPGPRLHLWGPHFSRFGGRNTTARSTASARMKVCGTFPRSMPRLSGARSLGHPSGTPFSFDGCVGSDLTGGWDILLYEKVALPLVGNTIINTTSVHLSQSLRGSLASLLKRDRIKDFFRFPVNGLFDGSKKLWFLRRRSVRCRLRRL